eukprot:Skav217542  [mRNA]  locus=scaffold467:270702:272252:- [translate_table: standard]
MYEGNIHVLSLRNWVEYMVSQNVWHALVGLKLANPARERAILLEFWRRYKVIRPTHEIFQRADAGLLDLSRCAPLLLHGDEGRGRKKSGFLCVTYFSYIGFGTIDANTVRKEKPYHLMRLNYAQNPYTHRLVTSVLPKMLRDHLALKDILDFISSDASSMLTNGVKDSQGHTYSTCVLQCVGDWQWLVKAGSLTRSYYNVEKRPRKQDANPRGICHLCAAGQNGVLWENYRGMGRKPTWYPTMLTQDPFQGQPALNRIPFIPGQQPHFYAFDLFHSWHLGVGKSFAAGCLAMASDYMWATNVDSRLEQLSCLFMTYCEENHETAHLNSLTRPVLGWMDRNQYPNGYWSKGHTTTTLCKFFETWAKQQEDASGDDLMQLALDACCKINRVLRIMYESDIWLSRGVATDVAQLGMTFLEGYKRLATKSYHAGKNLFPHMPKGHAMEHIFFQLVLDLEIDGAQFFLNPLNHSVQISEDMVGRISRVARRTAPQQVVTRVLQRTLQAAYKHWRERGYIRD